MRIAVLTNPRSRANRRDPELAERLAARVQSRGELLAPRSIEELDRAAARLAAEAPAVIAVHGGDGTLHVALTALVQAFAGRPLPPLAILAGGTMNVVASSLGILADPESLLAQLAGDARAGRAPETLTRRCLRIDGRHGFVFGNGLMANFLEEYYAKKGYGPGRALWVLGRTFGSALVGGVYARRVFRRFVGQVRVDGQLLPWSALTGVGAATVREVGMGFKLNHRADEDPERFSVLAVHAGPLALALDLPAVHAGRGVAPGRAWSAVARQVVLESGDESAYTIDGDLYRVRGRLEIAIGPALRLVVPRGAVRLGGGTPPR